MTPQVEALLQGIGQQAIEEAEGEARLLLMYAEVEEGVASADLFYSPGPHLPIKFRFASSGLREMAVSLWEQWTASGRPAWQAMSYTINEGKFDVLFEYPDQLAADEDLTDRRPGAIQKHFGDVPVDYSNPR